MKEKDKKIEVLENTIAKNGVEQEKLQKSISELKEVTHNHFSFLLYIGIEDFQANWRIN